VVQLEKKLDDLVNLLSRPKGQGVVNEQVQNSMLGCVPQTSPTSIHQNFNSAEPLGSRQPILGSPQADTNSSSTIYSQHQFTSHPNGSQFNLLNQEGAFLLLEFRTSMAHQFPFVVIPPEATSEALRKERPLLWKAILTAACCLNPSRQEEMGQELVEEFSTRLLSKAEKSLDLLQALLIYLAWLVALSAPCNRFINLLQPKWGFPLTIGQVSLSLPGQSAAFEPNGLG
jgi:hypothetical protein